MSIETITKNVLACGPHGPRRHLWSNDLPITCKACGRARYEFDLAMEVVRLQGLALPGSAERTMRVWRGLAPGYRKDCAEILRSAARRFNIEHKDGVACLLAIADALAAP